MASKKIGERKIDQMSWLTKQEAMTYVNVSEEIFDTDWRPYLNRYDVGKRSPMYKKAQIDAFMESRLCIKGRPFEEWRPRTIG